MFANFSAEYRNNINKVKTIKSTKSFNSDSNVNEYSPSAGDHCSGTANVVKRGEEINKFGISNCTSIVIYGSNLGSTIDKGRYSFSVKN
jgi:hypothetical protein